MNQEALSETELVRIYGEELIAELKEWSDMPVNDQLFYVDEFLKDSSNLLADLSG